VAGPQLKGSTQENDKGGTALMLLAQPCIANSSTAAELAVFFVFGDVGAPIMNTQFTVLIIFKTIVEVESQFCICTADPTD